MLRQLQQTRLHRRKNLRLWSREYWWARGLHNEHEPLRDWDELKEALGQLPKHLHIYEEPCRKIPPQTQGWRCEDGDFQARHHWFVSWRSISGLDRYAFSCGRTVALHWLGVGPIYQYRRQKRIRPDPSWHRFKRRHYHDGTLSLVWGRAKRPNLQLRKQRPEPHHHGWLQGSRRWDFAIFQIQ